MSETTKIVQCFLPSLVAGKYTVTVDQDIKKDGNITVQPAMSKNLQFGIDAARFKLGSNDIYSVYPPASPIAGQYSESLPHIVFKRRTLPWERTLDGKPPVFERNTTPEDKRTPQSSPPIPWMALLLFDEDEMKSLKIQDRKIREIVQMAQNDTVTRPEIYADAMDITPDTVKLMSWENVDDGCLAVDITKEQFDKNLPSVADLSFLAHSKLTSIANKDKEGITDTNNEDGTVPFSVVVGNRLPQKGKKHTAVLVSLEGYHNYLVPGKNIKPKKVVQNGNSVRLVVLATWEFSNSGKATFSQLIGGLTIKNMQVNKGANDPAYVAEIAGYFDSGYVPLEHLTRSGAKTISWYHGPFTPMLSPKMSKSISFSSADAALRYDKTTGMFDVSFAAAWQLGRMLGLQSQSFTRAMLNCRIQQKQEEIKGNRRKKINDILGDTSNILLKDKVIKRLGGTPVSEAPATLRNSEAFIPQDVKDFMGKLYRLQGVPLNYLVPGKKYLEKTNNPATGTLAFFYVDPNWIEALLDGALSIGRINNADGMLDTVISQVITDAQGASASVLNVTGFMLRSELVSGWKGVEVEAFDADNKKLPALRFEQVDDDTLLTIFHGNVFSVVITQPYEGLHFGIKIKGDKYNKSLKNENGAADGSAVLDLTGSLIATDRTMQVAELAKLMNETLVTKKWLQAPSFTSAEFAYQMVDSPVKHTIFVNLKNTK